MRDRFQTRILRARASEILGLTEAVLAERGCVAFTVDEVAARAGVAKGTIYNHFSGREALIREALGAAGARTRQLLDDCLADPSIRDLPALLACFVRAAIREFRQAQTQTDRSQLCYPCCLALTSCPYQAEDIIAPALGEALAIRQAGDPASEAPPASVQAAALLRSLLTPLLAKPADRDPADIESVIDLTIRLVQPIPLSRYNRLV